MLKKSGKVILDPHRESDQRQNLTTSRELPLSYPYQLWLTSINAFVSYLADTQRNTS